MIKKVLLLVVAFFAFGLFANAQRCTVSSDCSGNTPDCACANPGPGGACGDGFCTNYQTDNLNCGSFGNQCDMVDNFCTSGECVCKIDCFPLLDSQRKPKPPMLPIKAKPFILKPVKIKVT